MRQRVPARMTIEEHCLVLVRVTQGHVQVAAATPPERARQAAQQPQQGEVTAFGGILATQYQTHSLHDPGPRDHLLPGISRMGAQALRAELYPGTATRTSDVSQYPAAVDVFQRPERSMRVGHTAIGSRVPCGAPRSRQAANRQSLHSLTSNRPRWGWPGRAIRAGSPGNSLTCGFAALRGRGSRKSIRGFPEALVMGEVAAAGGLGRISDWESPCGAGRAHVNRTARRALRAAAHTVRASGREGG